MLLLLRLTAPTLTLALTLAPTLAPTLALAPAPTLTLTQALTLAPALAQLFLFDQHGTDLLQTWVVRGAFPYGCLLHQFGGGLLLLVQQLHRLLQVGLGWRLGLWWLALAHGSSTRALAEPRGRTGTGRSLLTVGNVSLLGGLGAGLSVNTRLKERSRHRHTWGEGEAWVHLEAWKSNWRRNHIGWGRETCKGTIQET